MINGQWGLVRGSFLVLCRKRWSVTVIKFISAPFVYPRNLFPLSKPLFKTGVGAFCRKLNFHQSFSSRRACNSIKEILIADSTDWNRSVWRIDPWDRQLSYKQQQIIKIVAVVFDDTFEDKNVLIRRNFPNENLDLVESYQLDLFTFCWPWLPLETVGWRSTSDTTSKRLYISISISNLHR